MLPSHRSRAVALVVAMASASLLFHQWASWDSVLLSEIRDGPYTLRLAPSQDDSELSVYVPQTSFPGPGPYDANASAPSRDEETLSCEGLRSRRAVGSVPLAFFTFFDPSTSEATRSRYCSMVTVMLAWTKLWVLGYDVARVAVYLDADQVVLGPLDALIDPVRTDPTGGAVVGSPETYPETFREPCPRGSDSLEPDTGALEDIDRATFRNINAGLVAFKPSRLLFYDRHGCTWKLHDQMLINCLCFDSSPATPLMQSAMKELGLQCRTTTWQYGVFLEYPAACPHLFSQRWSSVVAWHATRKIDYSRPDYNERMRADATDTHYYVYLLGRCLYYADKDDDSELSVYVPQTRFPGPGPDDANSSTPSRDEETLSCEGLRSRRAVGSVPLAFFTLFDPSTSEATRSLYCSMATVMVRSLQATNKGAPVFVLHTVPVGAMLRGCPSLARALRNGGDPMSCFERVPPLAWPENARKAMYGNWQRAWTKLWVLGYDVAQVAVYLDADQVVLGPLDALIDPIRMDPTGETFVGSPETFPKAFHEPCPRGSDSLEPDTGALEDIDRATFRNINAGLMAFRPSRLLFYTAMKMARQKDWHGCTSRLHDQMIINCLCFDSSPATPLMQRAMKELGLQCRTTTWQYGVFLEYPAACPHVFSERWSSVVAWHATRKIDYSQLDFRESMRLDTRGESAAAKDLFLGYYGGYKAQPLCRLVNTLLRTGFRGDIVLLLSRMKQEDLDTIARSYPLSRFPTLKLVDSQPYEDTRCDKSAHLKRFFAMYQYLREQLNVTSANPCMQGAHWCTVDSVRMPYRYVLTSDTKDVAFQSDPFEWLHTHLGRSVSIYGRQLDLVIPGEGIRTSEHWWTSTNAQLCTPSFYEHGGRDSMYYNAGTIAGTQEMVMSVMRSIYEIGKHMPDNYMGVCDQAVLNQLLAEDPVIRSRTLFATICSGWVYFSSFEEYTWMRNSPVLSEDAELGRVYAQCAGMEHRVAPAIVHRTLKIDLVAGADNVCHAV
eukprot:m51a1_g11132 hypothetical protein (1004) ;mRNA; r:160607-170348